METIKNIDLRIESLKNEILELGQATEKYTNKDLTFWVNRAEKFNILVEEIKGLEKLKKEINLFN